MLLYKTIKNDTTIKLLFLIVLAIVSSCSYQSHLKVANTQSLVYIWRAGDSLDELAKAHQTTPLTIRKKNDIYTEEDLAAGKKIYIPQSKAKSKSAAASSRQQPSVQKTGLIWPVVGKISSGFGPRNTRMHHGIDIPAKAGTPIKAVAPGVVYKTNWMSGYGKTVQVKHDNNIITLYAHASEFLVREKERVAQGDTLALVGRTGNATTDLLHFEIRLNGVPVDPEPYLSPIGYKFADKQKR